MLELYKNIKLKRTELKMTQSELAEKLGYADKSMIAKIEKGMVDLTQSKILAFAEALRTTPAELMGWDEPKPTTLAAHFDGDEYTESELNEIRQFAEFVKNKRQS